MKRKIIPITLALSLVGAARAGFTPIPLNPSSYNADPVVEATAPPSINDFIGVTPDAGTNKTGNTWYEMGYNTNIYANPTYTGPLTGLPHPGDIITALGNPNYSFQMPPTYTGNCVIFVGHNTGAWSPIMGPGTFTFIDPTNYDHLSILSGTGNGANNIQATVNHADGTSENLTFSSPDWFTGTNAGNVANAVWRAGGLFNLQGGVNNINGNAGTLWHSDIALTDTTSPVTNIVFSWLTGNNNANSPWGNGRTFIFGVSGSTNAGVNYSPIAVTGYDHDGVMESNGPPTTGTGIPSVLTNSYCNFTMDNGIWLVNWTWYEHGYYADYPNTGLPAAGSTITSATEPSIQYTMPSTYVGNCAVCLSSNLLSDTITFASPTAAGALSFLCGGGNGGFNLRVEIGYQGGGSETNWITVPDWFNRTAPWAYVTFGQARPEMRSLRNTPDQLQNNWLPPQTSLYGHQLLPLGSSQPFSRDPRNGGQSFPDLPIVRLYDAVIQVANSGTPISTINVVVTNTGAFGNSTAIFAVSGSAGAPPVLASTIPGQPSGQPTGLVTDSATGSTNATTAAANADNIRITKGWQGTNNIWLIVSNSFPAGAAYQWKKAPRGGGWLDRFMTDYDLSTFANVTAPNVGGAQSPVLTISNATLADSGDYLVVVTNNYGSTTSFVATVMVLSTNAIILSGVPAGDVITKWSSDGTSGNGQETFTSAIDQKQQKWLSTGLGGTALDGTGVGQGTVPCVGPYGFIVTPINGASIVNSIVFYCANDTPGRDPRDYLLEGSNDGGTTFATITGGQLLGTLMLPTGRDSGGTANLNGAFTNPCVEVDFANATSYKTYRVSITNSMEPVATPLMQVAEIQFVGSLIPNPPVWVLQPVPDATVFVGTAPTWGVEAGGYPPPKFQWYRIPFGGSAALIPNATNSTYTLSNPQPSNNGDQFYATAQNNAGTITSSASTLSVIAAPIQSYPSTILVDHPSSYWRLNEGPDNGTGNNGVVAHDYAGAHNGTYSNAVLQASGYNPISDPDKAAIFDGFPAVDNYVDNIDFIDLSRGANKPGQTFSVEAWVLGVSQSTDAAIITKGYNGVLNVGTGTGTEQFVLDVTGTPRTFRFLVREASGQGHVVTSISVPYNTNSPSLEAMWHHVVGVCDQPNGNIFLYVDGQLAGTGGIGTNTGILNQPSPVTIGARKSTQAADYDNQWNGTIDDVALYPVALSASQVLAHYNAAQRAPLFSLQPVNVHTNDNSTAVFRSVAYGPGSVTYQWYNSDGTAPTTAIGSQTSANYAFTANPGLNNNFYQVIAANAYGSVTSIVVQLTVESGAPGFVFGDLPLSNTVFLAHVIQLHVGASGTAPFTYQWQRSGTNLLDDFRIAGSTTDTLTIGYAGFPDTASYQCFVTGTATTGSTIDALTITTNIGVPFFNASGAASEWSLQGTTVPVLTSANGVNTLQMTANLGSTERTAFLNTKQNIASFQASFIYTMVTAAGGADGVAFCIQNSAVNVQGGAGGGLGVSGITPSVELDLNIYAPNTRGIEFGQNGAVNTPFISLLPNIGIGDNNDPVRVDLNYNGTVMAIKFTDTTTAAIFTTNWTVNIPTVVGASTAWVGFTGADGGVNSTQNISWSPASSTHIAITAKLVGPNLVLSWPASAGAYLQISPSVSPTAWVYDNVHTFRVVGANATVTVPPSLAGDYFRLQLFP
jgi:hypothetical protein